MNGRDDAILAAARDEARQASLAPVYCATCGVTLGRDARRRGNTHCRKHRIGRTPQIWTREACISALRDFHDEHGRAPTAPELGAGNAAIVEVERVDWLPWYGSLLARFGTSRAAMLAAGIPPNAAGRYVRDSAAYARKAGT